MQDKVWRTSKKYLLWKSHSPWSYDNLINLVFGIVGKCGQVNARRRSSDYNAFKFNFIFFLPFSEQHKLFIALYLPILSLAILGRCPVYLSVDLKKNSWSFLNSQELIMLILKTTIKTSDICNPCISEVMDISLSFNFS